MIRKLLAPSPKPPAANATPAAAATPRAPWQVAALVWGVPVALAWIGTFGYHACDWLRRVAVIGEGASAAATPSFDLARALLLATVLTVVWSVSLLAIALSVARQRWSERRRQRRAAQGRGGPSSFVWYGLRFHRKE